MCVYVTQRARRGREARIIWKSGITNVGAFTSLIGAGLLPLFGPGQTRQEGLKFMDDSWDCCLLCKQASTSTVSRA